MKKIVVIIPVFNEEKTLARVLREVQKYVDDIVVIDDGSEDSSGEVARQAGVITIRHFLNRGLGAALETGRQAALLFNPDYLITFDADSQHKAEDLPRLLKEAEESKAEIVIGSRLLDASGMPFFRIIANKIGNLATFLLFGLKVTDSQSGLRLFSAEAAAKLRLKSNRMEVSSEIIKEIKRHNFKFREIPIKAIYTDYSLSKGQGFWVGLKTLFNLVLQKFSR